MDAATITEPTQFSTCTWLKGSVSLTVPTAGRIVIEATSTLVIDQTGYQTPQSDYAGLLINRGAGVCDTDPGQSQVAFDPVTGYYKRNIVTVPSRRIVPVTAGTHSFYLNGFMYQGKDESDRYDHGTMTATFFPDP